MLGVPKSGSNISPQDSRDIDRRMLISIIFQDIDTQWRYLVTQYLFRVYIYYFNVLEYNTHCHVIGIGIIGIEWP